MGKASWKIFNREFLKAFLSFLQPILQQSRDVLGVIPFKGLARVILDGLLQGFEQVLVVDNVAVFLVVTVQAVDATDRLE